MTVVLDTSAVLALIFGEPGNDRVAAVLHDSRMSAVNLSESISKMTDRGFGFEDARRVLTGFPIRYMSFSNDLAFLAGSLRSRTKDQNLSFADRACLATAISETEPALTADRMWGRLDLGVEIELIR